MGVFSVGNILPFVQLRVTDVSSIEFSLKTILGSVDHFLGIYIISFPLAAMLKLGFKFTVNIDDV